MDFWSVNLFLEHSPEAFQPGFTPGRTSDTKFPHWFQALFSWWPFKVQLAVGISSNASSHTTSHSDPFCLCWMRTSDSMTNTFTSVPTFSVNGFNYHDRTLEDKRGNDFARLYGEPRSRWPDPACSPGIASISPYFFLVFYQTKWKSQLTMTMSLFFLLTISCGGGGGGCCWSLH